MVHATVVLLDCIVGLCGKNPLNSGDDTTQNDSHLPSSLDYCCNVLGEHWPRRDMCSAEGLPV